MHPLPRPLTHNPPPCLGTVSCSAWSAFDLSNSPGVAPDKNCSSSSSISPAFPACLPMPVLLLCSASSSASLSPFPLYLSALYASADSGMQTSRKEVSALASQATTLATDTSTEREREREIVRERVRKGDSMCVSVWDMLSYWFCCILWARQSQIQLETLSHSAELYMQIVQWYSL